MFDRNAQILAAVKSGMTYGEVAAELKIKRGVVAGVCHRAKLKVGHTPERMQRVWDAKSKAAAERRRIAWASTPMRAKRLAALGTGGGN